MKYVDINQIRKFKTSKDYSKLSFPELLHELALACEDINAYRKKMVKECNLIRKETSNDRNVDEVV